jgi:AraC-like DNA-binding protein
VTQPHRNRIWMTPGVPGVTLFRAEGLQQRFARHSHEEYALGVITQGALGFRYRGANQLAGVGQINLVVPGEVHTGQPALGESWSYRMFYIQPGVLSELSGELQSASSRRSMVLPFFPPGVIDDVAFAAEIRCLHQDLDEIGTSVLEAQSRITTLFATWIRRYGESRCRSSSFARSQPDVSRVRDALDACWRQKPTLDMLARLVDLSTYQLLRAFTRQFGMPPHAYLVQRQVEDARRRLDRGAGLADAAIAAGFADQSHFNRHFKRTFGITPGCYRNFVQESRGARS